MEPEEALQFLDRTASLAPLNRAGHIQVQQAVVMLSELIVEYRSLSEAKKKEPPEGAGNKKPDSNRKEQEKKEEKKEEKQEAW